MRIGVAVHRGDLADESQLRIGDLAFEHTAIDAAEADGVAAKLLHLGHQLFVDESRQNGDDDVEAGCVGHPKTADELGRYPMALHPLGNHVAAAVDYHHLRAFPLQRYQVSQTGVVASQGAATDFHYDWHLSKREKTEAF